MIRACIALLFALTLAACGAKTFPSLCAAAPDTEGCGDVCDPGAANSCMPGFHCDSRGTCDLQCTQGGTECGGGYSCTTDGRCVPEDENPMNGPDANCPAVNFTPMPTTPSIGLVLDQSGSMFPPQSTRYAQMREALVGATGVVSQLESKAYFGSMLYTCGGDGTGPLALTSVDRGLNNANAIRTSIDSKTGGGNTPTHAAIDAMVASFAQNAPPAGSPPVIVLATDGLPNTCSNTGGGGQTAVVQSARASYMAGIPVYVLSINLMSQHFQDVANAGQGHQSGQPNIPYYLANNAQELQAAFDTIIKGVISCDLSLTSSIDPAQAMNGTVVVNGQTLTYGTDWILVNGNVIRIQGAACTALKTATNPTVAATFPCGSVIF